MLYNTLYVLYAYIGYLPNEYIRMMNWAWFSQWFWLLIRLSLFVSRFGPGADDIVGKPLDFRF